jgi:hypothetical protein
LFESRSEFSFSGDLKTDARMAATHDRGSLDKILQPLDWPQVGNHSDADSAGRCGVGGRRGRDGKPCQVDPVLQDISSTARESFLGDEGLAARLAVGDKGIHESIAEAPQPPVAGRHPVADVETRPHDAPDPGQACERDTEIGAIKEIDLKHVDPLSAQELDETPRPASGRGAME